MEFGKRLHSLIAIVLSLLPLGISAQPIDKGHKVDTLSIMDRLSIRTNGTDWLMMIPNVGIEFDLFNTNYNRYAVNLNFRYRPSTSTKHISPIIGEVTEIKLEGRMYWRERKATADGPTMYHLMPWHKLMSCRRMMPKHPKTVFYRGVYASYGKCALRTTGEGFDEQFAQAGITWGFLKNLYEFTNGNSIDFEIGISGGIGFIKSQRLRPDYINNEYEKYGYGTWRIYKGPVINEVHAALVYRLGKYPSRKKYRWRYDVDMEYKSRIDSIWDARMRAKNERIRNDSVFKAIAADFRDTYDSIISVRHQERQEIINKSAPARVAPLLFNTNIDKKEAVKNKKLAAIRDAANARVQKAKAAENLKLLKAQYAELKASQKAAKDKEKADKKQQKAEKKQASKEARLKATDNAVSQKTLAKKQAQDEKVRQAEAKKAAKAQKAAINAEIKEKVAKELEKAKQQKAAIAAKRAAEKAAQKASKK